MFNFITPTKDNDPFPARRARRRPRTAPEPRTGGPRDEPTLAPGAQSLDDEMLDVVQKFEKAYAELAPASREQQDDNTEPDDDFFAGLRDDLEKEPAIAKVPAARGASSTAARGTPSSRREPELKRELVAVGAGTHPRPETGIEELDIDEAITILREAETKGRADGPSRQPQGGRTIDVGDRAPMPFGGDAARALRVDDRAPTLHAAPALPREPELNWMAKSRRLSAALVAASVALIVGVAVGYVVGRSPDSIALRAKVPMTEQGGAQLRYDYDLRKR